MDRKDSVPVRPSHPAQAVLDQVGYRPEQAHVTLCGAMDWTRPLRPRPHRAAVRLPGILAARPGLSDAELARATFVTRQSMNVVLRALQCDGLLTRPDTVTT
jgi:hypothetical protein